jgi:murein DD-endopeptidase MepM/ murein hydrolase activator NlpD
VLSGGIPGRLVRVLRRRRRGITAISLAVVASALPARAEPGHALLGALGPGAGIERRHEPESSAASLVVSLDSARAFFQGPHPAHVTIRAAGPKALAVTVEAVRRADNAVVARWDLATMAPGASRSVTWDGKSENRIQREGAYTFRVRATGEGGSRARTSAHFVFLHHRFPVRGAHGYGDGGARFGAGRGFGGHQGQDVFAACGTPVVAARGGVVQFRAYQGRAGNYVVIDGAGTGVDYVYAHLRDPARFGIGHRVFTGQLIGFVGRTGDATACHLHLEMWTGPGWYAGGAPFDPLPALRAWDRAS